MPGHLSATEAPEDLWTCHECGWTYPNHHPSAKHRRNHKKVCGSVPGFIGAISSREAPPEPAVSMDGASSDDASSDDETIPDQTHEKCGHHHPTAAKVAPGQQTTAGVQHGGTRAAKSLCVTHRSKEPCLHSEEGMKPAPLTERTLSDQNNRQALQSTGSNLSPAVKTQHVRRRSAHALEGVWVCRHCGWTYPNAHPSAKHRRKHKKKCPALVVTRHAVAAGGSSDDASSDEENRIQRAAALEKAEAPETNNLPMPANLSLEAFLSRSGSMNGGSPQHASLREIQAPIILLSPRPVSRRDSFLSPRHRRESPSLLLSPRGSMKNPKVSPRAVNNQAQEVVTVTERKSESLSDLENEDPVVLNLPAVRTVVTNPQTVPAAENVGGERLQEGRRSLSDESDLNNSDGEAPRSPVSVLQTRHLLVPTITSTTTEEETKTSDQEETDEEVTEQLLHQEAAAAFTSDAEAQKDESIDEVVDIKQDSHEAAPELPPLATCEAFPEVDSLVSHPPAAAAEQKESQEVSSVNIIQPVDASPCTELQAAVTGATCVAKETQVAIEADEKVTLSEDLGSSLASVDNAHVENSASNTDIAEEQVSTTALAAGGSSDAVSDENEHHAVQDTNKGLILSDTDSCAKPLEILDLKEASEKTGSQVALAIQESSDLPTTVPVLESINLDTKNEGKIAEALPTEVSADQPAVVEEEDRDLLSSGPYVLSGQPPVETSVLKGDRDLTTLSSVEVSGDQPPVDITLQVLEQKDDNLPTLSSEATSANQPPVDTTVEVVEEKEGDLPTVSSEDQPPVETTVEVVTEENRDLRTLSSKDLPAGQAPVQVTVETVKETKSTHSTTSLSEVQETTNNLLDSLNAALEELNTLELGSQSTSLETLVPTAQSTKAIVPDDSEIVSATEKVHETLDAKPTTVLVATSTAIGISDLNSETLPTPNSQVVVTGPVGDCHNLDTDQEANEPDQIESQVTDVVEEKTTSSVAIDSHLSVGKQELPEASHHSGAAEDLWTFQRNPKKNRRTVHGSDATGGSWDDVPDDDHSHTEVVIASKGANDAVAEQPISSNSEAFSTPVSTSSITQAQVVLDEIKCDPSTVTEKEEQQVSPALAEVCEVNIKENPGVRELNDASVTTEEKTVVVMAEKVEGIEKEVLVVAETEESQVKGSGDMPASSGRGSSDSSYSSISVPEETGAGGSGTKQAVIQVPTGKQAPTVTIPEATEKSVGLFGHWRAREGKREPTLPRLPGSGKRKALPALSFGTENNFPVTKKQESRPGMKIKSRDLKSDSMKLRARARSCGPESPPETSPERGAPGSPEGIVKVRIETYERMIGKMRTFGPAPAPSPSAHKSPTWGKFSSPNASGLTIVTSGSHQHRHQQFEHEEAAAAATLSAAEQIAAVDTHLHNVEPKETTKLQDTHDAPEELLSHLRHCEVEQQQNNDKQDSSEPEDSSQRISKVALLLKEAAEHCLSPVPRLTKAY